MVNVMLLNEFLREHDAFLEEQEKVRKLEAALATGNERLKEQEAKIDTVSAAVLTNSTGPQVAESRSSRASAGSGSSRERTRLACTFRRPPRNAVRGTKGQMTICEKFAIAGPRSPAREPRPLPNVTLCGRISSPIQLTKSESWLADHVDSNKADHNRANRE